jgi:hypothetical protein
VRRIVSRPLSKSTIRFADSLNSAQVLDFGRGAEVTHVRSGILDMFCYFAYKP